MVLGLHWLDLLILVIYFLVIGYIGIYQGMKKTKSLGDFLVAGGKWGAVISFIFVFASALAGNEAVVVSGQAYESGLSGVWYWWSFLFATPVYYLFSIYYRRARVYNVCEFFEMRYDKNTSGIYSVMAGIITIVLCGTFLLAVGKILAGLTALTQQQCIWLVTIFVGSYVFAGGMMSTLMTDIIQGVMCLLFLSFMLLPFLFIHAGGWDSFYQYGTDNPEIWNLVDPEKMSFRTIFSLNLAALVGGISFPSIYNWIAVSKNEKAATQCGWGHLWKRIVTLLFAVYGILFVIIRPGMDDPEMAWGVVMKQILPVGFIGLLIASFFAAVMSSAATNATTSSAMIIDYFYRRILNPGKKFSHYLKIARIWAVSAIVIAALSTSYVTSIKQYVKLFMTLLSFLGVPILFGVWWKKSNVLGTWFSLVGGMSTYVLTIVYTMLTNNMGFVDAIEPSFEYAVIYSIIVAIAGMLLGRAIGKPHDKTKLKRFYVIMNTAIGKEEQLVDAGIKLPALVDAGMVDDKEEQINEEKLTQLYDQQSEEKFFGKNSPFEFRKQKDFPGYYKGLIRITIGCVLLVVLTWLIPRIVFIW